MQSLVAKCETRTTTESAGDEQDKTTTAETERERAKALLAALGASPEV
jgi:hypothetical protein